MINDTKEPYATFSAETLQELLEGAEQDLKAANERYNQLVADVGLAWEELVRADTAVNRLRKQVQP